MKKIFNKYGLIFLIIICLCFIFPCKCNAYVTYNEETYFEITEKNVSDFDYVQYENLGCSLDYNNSYIDFTGKVRNANLYDELSFNIKVSFFDSNFNLVSTRTVPMTLASQASRGFTIKFAIDSKNDFNDIKYYQIETEAGQITNGNSEVYQSSKYYEYVINSYDIDMVVGENNAIEITEKIDAYFNIEKHGIYRKIPIRNKVERLDGTTSYNTAKIRDILVSDESTVSTESGNKVIKIGNANKTITGGKDYTIKYTYDLGKDKGKNYDELYFNLIGTEWDTTIGNITFRIKMPKEFDDTKLGFSSGIKGTVNSSNISYEVKGNIIEGKYNGKLNPGEALTVRLELPEGYFIGANSNADLLAIIAIVFPIMFAIITFGLWYKFGKDEEVIETVEFYPPEGFNSAEIGFLYKGQADKEDVVSLLIYLANKGYIKITETEEESIFGKVNGFKITKLKEYDGNDVNERLFLKGLFKNKATTLDFEDLVSLMKNKKTLTEIEEENSKEKNSNDLEEVTDKDLYNSFYVTLNAIVSNLNKKENKQKIYEKSSFGKTIFIVLMIIATFLLITIKPVWEYAADTLLFALLFPGIGFTVLFKFVFGKTHIAEKIFGFVWGGLFGGGPWVMMVLPALLMDTIYLFAYILGLVCILIMIILSDLMLKRNAYGREMLGKIRGFKRFLETAEKSNLEDMVMKDPTYFYDILPYTYVLGVSEKWIEKFETIAIKEPDWYSGSSTFDMVRFGTFMNTTMSSATTAMSSSPSSSGGSGGGSSGGGSGGGGGGSW